MAVVGIAGESPSSDHQAALVGHGNTGFNAELVGLSCFALADAFDFRRMQGVKLVLVLRLLLADTFGAFEQDVQMGDGARRFTGHGRQFATYFTQYNAEDGALAFDGTPQALELLGVGVAAGLAAQFLSLLDEGLFQTDADALGGFYDLDPGDLQQAAIDRMGDGFILDRRIDNDPFKLGRTHGLGLHRSVDSCLEQFFNAGFADGGAEAANLGGIAGKCRRVVVLATKVLPQRPLLH